MTESDRDDAEDDVRAWSEEVRRRELSTALRRLEASGEVTSDERAIVAEASERIVASVVEQWLGDHPSDVDAAVVAAIVTE
jgi:hypothetical protein